MRPYDDFLMTVGSAYLCPEQHVAIFTLPGDYIVIWLTKSIPSHHWAAAGDPGTSPGMLPGVTGRAACLLPTWWASWPWWAIWAAHLDVLDEDVIGEEGHLGF